MNRYAVDAHALIWYLESNPRLGANARSAMGNPLSILFLPLIALAEACWTVAQGRCRIPTVADLLAEVAQQRNHVMIQEKSPPTPAGILILQQASYKQPIIVG